MFNTSELAYCIQNAFYYKRLFVGLIFAESKNYQIYSYKFSLPKMFWVSRYYYRISI